VQCRDDRVRTVAGEFYREAANQGIECRLGGPVAMPSAESVVRYRTNTRRKKYGDRPLPPAKQRKNMSKKFDELLQVQGYPVFSEYGDYLKAAALKHAEHELDVYRHRMKLEGRNLDGRKKLTS